MLIINILFILILIIGCITCVKYSLFRRNPLLTELTSILNACENCNKRDLAEKFSVYLLKRKIVYWNTLLTTIIGPSLVLSLVLGFTQFGMSFDTPNQWQELAKRISNPGIFFYLDVMVISYLSITIFYIDNIVTSFKG